MSFPENHEQDTKSSTFADDGTASHEFAADALKRNRDGVHYLGDALTINGATYEMTEERAEYIQVYLDDVRRRAMGGILWVEHWIDLTSTTGGGGTADAAIIQGNELIIEDLKYGTGERVYAKDEDGSINPQLGLYLLGLLDDALLLGHSIDRVTGVICQPRLGHIDEHTITVEELKAFGRKAAVAVDVANGSTAATHLYPGAKQCRWCRAKTKCPALASFVQDEVGCDFDTVQAEQAPLPPASTEALATALLAVPLIEDWCRAVRAEVGKLVTDGIQVIGPDGAPYKFVEGREGSRKWTDETAAEAALCGQLGPKAYSEPKLLTAPAAAKLLDKKATKSLWKDLFEPMIARGRGAPLLVVGSDPRPPYTGAASAEDFNDEI
jgi:hypothetical protein